LLYFSDNITTWDFLKDVEKFRTSEEPPGSVLLAREVDDPSAFGICLFSESGETLDIIEKPDDPPSNVAIGGIYLFDEKFWSYFDIELKKNPNDFSISSITRQYVINGNAVIRNIGRETWIDCGTPRSLLDASILSREGKI